MSYRKIYWTEHSKIKMRQYGLSKSKVLMLVYKPDRKEKGIAPGTVAVMKTNKVFSLKKPVDIKKPAKAPGEIWLMYKDTNINQVPTRKIISTWRYPGITKPREAIPIPDDIRQQLNDLL